VTCIEFSAYFFYILLTLHINVVDFSDVLVNKHPYQQLFHLVAIADSLGDNFLKLSALLSNKVPLAQREIIETLLIFVVGLALQFVSVQPILFNLFLSFKLIFLLQILFFVWLGVHGHKVDIHIGLLSDSPLPLEFFYFKVDFANLALDVDCLTNALFHNSLKLAKHRKGRNSIVLHSLSTLLHLHFFCKDSPYGKPAPTHREEREVERIWLPCVLVNIC